jgi:hypothetical protein
MTSTGGFKSILFDGIVALELVSTVTHHATQKAYWNLKRSFVCHGAGV